MTYFIKALSQIAFSHFYGAKNECEVHVFSSLAIIQGNAPPNTYNLVLGVANDLK